MKKYLIAIAALTTAFWSNPSYSKDEKCAAMAKLAATVYKNKASVNEFQLLQSWEETSNPIDFAFIRLFTGLAFNVNRLTPSKFEDATSEFCEKIVTAALAPESRTSNKLPSNCESIVAHSHIINSFKRTGDTPTTLRRQFLRTYNQDNSVHRVIADYLSLMSEMRFSSLLFTKSDEDFIGFSEKSCIAFTSYAARMDAAR